MSIFFTADTHFYHDNIRRHCNRPWDNLDDMNDALVENWNNKVSRRDEVWVVGDWAMIKNSYDPSVPRMKLYRRLRQRLNGKIHLILGNHDKMSRETYDCFTSVHDFGKEIKVDGQSITLCHYPLRSWNKSVHGSWHFFGHVHGRLDSVNTGLSIDVGVDATLWKYTPVVWEDLKTVMKVKRDAWEKLRFEVASRD